MKITREVNAIIWTVIAIAIMVTVYFQWSEHGEYTADSFLCSLMIHGGGCFLIGHLIDEKLRDNDK